MKKKEMMKCTIKYLDNGIPKFLSVWIEPENQEILKKILDLKLREEVTN